MRAILDWVVLTAAAFAAPIAYAQLCALFVVSSGAALPPLAGPLSSYMQTDWLYLIVTPLLIGGHVVLWFLLKDTPLRRRAVVGAIAQGGWWAVTPGGVMLFVMTQAAATSGVPQPSGSALAEMFGAQFSLIAALTYAALGALSGALAGFASREFAAV